MVKSIENAYRHMEITLANQLSLAYPRENMREVLKLVGTKWNIGTYFPGQLGVYLNAPIRPDRTNQKRIIYTTKNNELTKSQIEKQKNLWWAVHKEDHEICERLQEGRNSPIAISGGILSPHWEDSVRAFQKIVIKSMNKSKKEKNYA